ncbi:MAG: HAD family hydrolase [Jatrophihabitans sp.]|uniref:HAD family hydrolase n=1 Tax=Jatrophihabitans sp. TaxID=1932789 RepID=UPI003F82066A
MTLLVASDLDRTLIYSKAAAGRPHDGLVAVEHYEGADASFMTHRAAARFVELQQRATVVPVTTRLPAQYERVRLPGARPAYAVTANGGYLHVDGVIDPAWTRRVERRLRDVAPLGEVWDHVTAICHAEWTTKLRNARGLFCYAVIQRKHLPPGFLAEAQAWAAERGWRQSLQGRKLYWVPAPLTKSAAVAEVAMRAQATALVAAGDSLLDLDLLEAADEAIVPAHGELLDLGRAPASAAVTATTGVAAGEEIVDWFSERATR